MTKEQATPYADERGCNVVTHPRFNRPKVTQPHPSLRKGTIRFRRKPVRANSRESAKRFVEELCSKPILSGVPYEELERVLQAGGLCLGVSFVDGCGIIMRDVYRSP